MTSSPPVTTDKDEAFGNILNLSENESYVDLGAYNGDTIDEFLHYTNGNYKRIIAFEPNAKNFEKLKLHCKGMANVSLWQLGSYSKNTELIFNNKAGRNSAIADKGVATKVATVDTILCGMAAGYIKADVEGADMETLIGMQKTMENCKPKLNFSAYHRFEDIFRLALYIHSVNPDYKIFSPPPPIHSGMGYEFILYIICRRQVAVLIFYKNKSPNSRNIGFGLAYYQNLSE